MNHKEAPDSGQARRNGRLPAWIWLTPPLVLLGMLALFTVLFSEYLDPSKNPYRPATVSHDDPGDAFVIPDHPSEEESVLSSGKKLYKFHCMACHQADGGGLAGPNLTDDFWIHGSSFSNTITIIQKGVPTKGMIAWEKIFTPKQIYASASYIFSLRGSTPKRPKYPEGTRAPDES